MSPSAITTNTVSLIYVASGSREGAANAFTSRPILCTSPK